MWNTYSTFNHHGMVDNILPISLQHLSEEFFWGTFCTSVGLLYIPVVRWLLNTLRPRQNGRHYPDDIFKCIFLNENAWIPIKISLKFVPKGPINKIPALVQIMAWRRSGDKPLSEQWWLVYWRIYASLGLNELTFHQPVDSTLPYTLWTVGYRQQVNHQAYHNDGSCQPLEWYWIPPS